MTFAIRVERLAKRYHISRTGRARYRTLRETVAEAVARPLRRLADPSSPGPSDEFWALRDVTFDVEPGDAVGVIGRNGSGKSTLLKILTRITEPSHGTADLYGRVGSLLEVGTGFHPELTGRENIYLNGSILGMTRAEIRRQFDAILEFSGVEPFLDMPVKRYSSGMKVRLAFSVAAHLQPEILLIDEVLAVGDLAFQQKCLGRMGEITSTGRTVIFVSHDMLAVRRLCRRAILIDSGRILAQGDVDEVIDHYLDQQQKLAGTGAVLLSDWQGERLGPARGKIVAVRTLDSSGAISSLFRIGEPCTIEIDLAEVGMEYTLSASVIDRNGICVYHLRSQDAAQTPVKPTAQRVRVTIPELRIREGDYVLNVWLGDAFNRVEECVRGVLSFSVRNSGTTVTPVLSVIVEPGHWQFL